MKQRIVFECIQDFLVTIVITTAATLKGKGFSTAGAFVQEVLVAWIINLIVAFLIPEGRLAEGFCQLLGVQGKPVPRYFLTLAVIVFINVTCVVGCLMIWKAGVTSLYFVMFWNLYPTLLLVGYIGACLIYPVSQRLTKCILRENQQEA